VQTAEYLLAAASACVLYWGGRAGSLRAGTRVARGPGGRRRDPEAAASGWRPGEPAAGVRPAVLGGGGGGGECSSSPSFLDERTNEGTRRLRVRFGASGLPFVSRCKP
jgi:hypothetical protein